MENWRDSAHLYLEDNWQPRPTTLRNHIPLGQLFGIRIWLSRWVLYMIGAIALWNGMEDPAYLLPTLLALVALALIVLLHELGHSVVAKHFGVKVSHITLMPLGGVAWMEEIPEDPKIEGWIAVGGPAVNFILALGCLPFLFLLPEQVNALSFSPQVLLTWFFMVNLVLGTFNLIPAFPMDGGRLLRAYFGRRMDWLAATEKAVGIGKTIAIIGGLAGLFGGLFTLPLIAGYVWFMGQRELFSMRARKLGHAFPSGAFGAGQGGPFGQAAAAFGFPQAQRQAPTRDAQPSEPQRPAPQAPPSPTQGAGFSEADIKRLEHFRGPLTRNWHDAE